MTFLADIRARAAATPRRIIFPETADDRTRAAIAEVARLRIAEPIAVLDPSAPETHAAVRRLGVDVRDPATDPLTAAAAEQLLSRRAARGLTNEQAAAFLHTPLFFADAAVAAGEADGCVAGAIHTTGEVLRAALWLVGPAPEVKTVSSSFYMVVAPFRGAGEEVLTFCDCAVVRYPTPSQLADIAIAAAEDRRRVVGDIPFVAFLSFSTKGSADGPSVDLVRAAVAEVRARAPGLAVDGELQGDAALASQVAARKGPGQPGRRPGERARVSLARRGKHRVQAGAAAGRCERRWSHRSRLAAAVQRSFARRGRRRHYQRGRHYRAPSRGRAGGDNRVPPGEDVMSFSIKKEGDVVVVDVEGQLIVGNRQELKQKVLDELERGEKKFLIDFSQTGYIDSSGLGVLVSLSKKIREQGGELRLANLNDDLKTLFELTKLDTLFQIADTRDRALQSF
jgi:phosphate acetyltransferase